MVLADSEKEVMVSGKKDKEILQTFLSSAEVEVGALSSTTSIPKKTNTKSVEKEIKQTQQFCSENIICFTIDPLYCPTDFVFLFLCLDI